MKKFLICTLSAALLLLTLTACGGKSQAQTDHDIPNDLNDTTMGGGSGTLAPDYGNMDVTPSQQPADTTPSQSPGPSDSQVITDENGVPAGAPDQGGMTMGNGTEGDTQGQSGTDQQGMAMGPGGTDQQGNDQQGQGTQPGITGNGQDGQQGTQPPAQEEVPTLTLTIPAEANVVSEVQALSHDVPVVASLSTSAPGTLVASNQYASIDYSNTADGYVVVNYSAATDKRIKCIVKGPSTSYNYNLTPGKADVLPLSDGNGTYTVTIYQNVSGTKYASVVSQTMDVRMTNEFGPFLHSNQYVDFEAAPNTTAKAAELCAGIADPLQKVTKVYTFVVQNIGYDMGKAQTVQSGYLPVLDTVLANRTGICFDYAALMTGMLRSQGVPCKLVVGYAGGVYHAWISVWSDETGWVEGVVFFDGTTWQRMDPTFDSTGGGSESIRNFIGNGSNYQTKYLY